MGKPRFNNLFFVIPIFVVILNYIALGISYHIQNNITGLTAWMTAIRISDVSLIVILLLLIIRIIFICTKKINLTEFLIWFIMNLIALFSCIAVITDRI